MALSKDNVKKINYALFVLYCVAAFTLLANTHKHGFQVPATGFFGVLGIILLYLTFGSEKQQKNEKFMWAQVGIVIITAALAVVAYKSEHGYSILD